ncbi:21188_t:CDS:2, partial [Cetraspora pellucida]
VFFGIVFTDSDPSMIRLIKDINPNSQHLLCIFHIDLNLQKKLKRKLGNQFEEFCCKFYICQNSFCEELFEYRWNKLIKQYLAAAKYLSDTLYITKHLWAIPWIRRWFTAGVQRTFEKFEAGQNSLSTVSMPMLNERFFDQVDDIIKSFLTSVILEKQRSQMNQSVCYDITQVTKWHHLIESEGDNKEISIGIRKQEQDTRQILFSSLVKNIPQEIILKHFLSIRTNSHSSHLTIKSTKAVYAELAKLSKKAIDCVIKADMQYELSNIFKSFIYDIQNKVNKLVLENLTDVNNSIVIKHKEQPSKRLKVNVEKSLYKGKEVLLDSTYINLIEDDTSNSVENLSNTKGQKYENT